ncbi:MAG: hypothetical protein DMG96_41355 [Acidobacteria bacterium]|nr:MAG: hypothetical protein DMG96_41355 [Acidobacteriota bacterium]
MDWPDFGPFQEWWLPLTITTLLAGALDDVLQTVGASEQVLKLVQERPQVLEHGRDWLSILSMATSYASYYAWANAFGTVLEIGSAIEVDGIGRFHKAQGRIEFEAHTKFQNLLDVNIPLARQFAA